LLAQRGDVGLRSELVDLVVQRGELSVDFVEPSLQDRRDVIRRSLGDRFFRLCDDRRRRRCHCEVALVVSDAVDEPIVDPLRPIRRRHVGEHLENVIVRIAHAAGADRGAVVRRDGLPGGLLHQAGALFREQLIQSRHDAQHELQRLWERVAWCAFGRYLRHDVAMILDRHGSVLFCGGGDYAPRNASISFWTS
jgi:hypothetical protein